MSAKRLLVLGAASAVFALVAACSSNDKPASMSRTFGITDENGRKAGTMILSPLGSGEVRDSDGRLIGRVSPP